MGNKFILWAIGLTTVSQFFFTYLPLAQPIFGTAAIPLGDWLRLLFLTSSVFLLVEIEKIIFRHIEKRKRMQELRR